MNQPRDRPSPDALLRATRRERRGKLKIFLGAAPGVGKTYEMLREGAERMRGGVDVVVGVVETHGRAETQALVEPLEILPRRAIDYRGHRLEEMDLDALLARRPGLALVDELAHTNVEGSRHPKRWQDVEELLEAGIDVYSTLNIQHVESLNDVVAGFTRVRVRETVPDGIFDDAEVEVVDLPPDELIERLKAGKVYIPAEATRALDRFFSKANLSALREMALRRAAQSVDASMLDHLDSQAITGTYAGGERVLVAVSELPGADALVRAGKRLADAMKAPWQAVFIETPRAAGFDAAAKQRVADSLRLAASLGATIATVPATGVVDGLRTHVAGMRATQLVLGKSVRSWWFELRHGSVVEAMLRGCEGLAVHVIPAGEAHGAGPPRTSARLPKEARDPTAWGVIAGLLGLTIALGYAAEPWIGRGGTDLLFLLPVLVAAARYGLTLGAVTALLAGIVYNFFFLPPLYTFSIADPQSLLTVFVLIGVATLVANLAGRLKARATLGARSAHENAAIAAFGQALARVSDWEGTSQTVCDEMHRLLGVPVILLYERSGRIARVSACPDDAAALGPLDQAAAEWAWSRGEVTGVGSSTLVASEWQFHPLQTALGVLAVVGLAGRDGRDPIGPDRATLLSTLLGQAALAHERLRLEDELREIATLRERDRLRAALLSSIGHDLRTPLTAAAAAVDAVANEAPDAPSIPLARAGVARLRHFLDDLIGMVRIDSGQIEPRFEAIDLTDAVASAVHDLKHQLRGHHLDFAVPPDLPLVRADPVLLHHILINLLSNAVVHGVEGGRIAVKGSRVQDEIRLIVADDGPGLGTDADRVFGQFQRGDGDDRSGGSGLGLAIAKAFAEAMAARLTAANGADGGATFTLNFTLIREPDAA
ncbi:sensor histidine kinase [Sphingomonas sp. AX6]|uniref:sensor histidine kinase n=1 Tax=Sphingomonas sp. AX6 TaxID=2653171 RepID=UPI00135BF688|nr:sensor histidine kinase KdpD [Sphingomonas sp. AX6]